MEYMNYESTEMWCWFWSERGRRLGRSADGLWSNSNYLTNMRILFHMQPGAQTGLFLLILWRNSCLSHSLLGIDDGLIEHPIYCLSTGPASFIYTVCWSTELPRQVTTMAIVLAAVQFPLSTGMHWHWHGTTEDRDARQWSQTCCRWWWW